jgi:iron(III) transport system substrate-binding protein
MRLRTVLLATAAGAVALPALADVNVYTTRQPD